MGEIRTKERPKNSETKKVLFVKIDIFFLHNSKKSCTFALVIQPTPWDCVFGWDDCRHNKGVITRFVLGISEPGKFYKLQDIAAFDMTPKSWTDY